MAGPIGRVARGVSGLVGLGQEAYHHNKEKKAQAAASGSGIGQPQPQSHSEDRLEPPSYTHADTEKGETDISISSDEDDEDLWLEDDAQEAIQPHKDCRPHTSNAEKWAEAFIQRNPAPPNQLVSLPAPVVIPQKRPGARTRGFVRAYAPALADSGIDQKAWLEFMDGFQDQTKEQGWFNVTNLAVALSVLSYTAAVAPSIIVHLSALAVHTSIEAGRRAYISKKTNSYLDQLNAHYFQPRGLYAMVMLYDPDKKEGSQVLDFESLSANAISKKTSDDGHKNPVSGFRASSGKTIESQIPTVCPLVFPELENATPEQQANGFKRAVGFARDYYDRREQAMFAAHNQGSKLNHEQKPFASKYGDPTTFEHSGLIGVLTGGAVDPMKRRKERRMRMREMREQSGRRTRRGGGPIGMARKGVRKVMQERVLYLMVVNMPSQEDMEVAAQMEAKMKAEQPNWFEKWQASRGR